MVRVFNSATGRFEECSACEQKRLAALEAQQAQARQNAIKNTTFQPQRVPRTVYATSSYATGSITRKFAGLR